MTSSNRSHSVVSCSDKHHLTVFLNDIDLLTLISEPWTGARVYYLRKILHDWSDAECMKILRWLRLAMSPNYSKLLINQRVVPAQGATSFMTHQDLNMMSVYARIERTEQLWQDLLKNAGLRIEKIWRPDDAVSECLIEAMLAD